MRHCYPFNPFINSYLSVIFIVIAAVRRRPRVGMTRVAKVSQRDHRDPMYGLTLYIVVSVFNNTGADSSSVGFVDFFNAAFHD